MQEDRRWDGTRGDKEVRDRKMERREDDGGEEEQRGGVSCGKVVTPPLEIRGEGSQGTGERRRREQKSKEEEEEDRGGVT